MTTSPIREKFSNWARNDDWLMKLYIIKISPMGQQKNTEKILISETVDLIARLIRELLADATTIGLKAEPFAKAAGNR